MIFREMQEIVQKRKRTAVTRDRGMSGPPERE
jgi:hypothetical protein